ncbi:MAG: tRNA 4-thiouridine(8) synthase ThiI [Candidatus Aminicenantes bacterium]|nr:tRNA 4-thiouridine(8) synthase ThiI [Candidatus Aminicenantes bacterium]
MEHKMKFNSIIVRYGEISLKGKNRKSFELKLKSDIEGFLKARGIDFSRVDLRRGRIYIRGIDQVPGLEKIMGVHSYSPALEIERNMEALEREVLFFIPMIADAQSFRVSCQRVDKRFPIKSVDLEQAIGHMLHLKSGTPVKLKDPAMEVHIEIGEDGIFLFGEKIRGYSGMPYGSAGKLVSLVSGGIDSPVATFLMMKRGVEPILLHFELSQEDTQKVIKLKEKLEEYASGREIKLYVIPRDEIFKGKFSGLYNNGRYQPYICVICKHLMHKKAGEIAKQEGALGIITGDNLAQVASQTLKNLFAYQMTSEFPVYSPLISFEKEQTVKIAREIGTYDLSVVKAKGCTPPKNPKTGVSITTFHKILNELGL